MVTTANIATVLRRPLSRVGSAELAQWEQWIADAQMLIRKRLGDLALLDQEVLAYVVREAVVAQIRKPDDATQVDIAVDDGRVSRRYESSKGRVTILEEWWAMLTPTGDSSDAFSVRPAYEPDTCLR
jgi:hypothetical protein